MSRWRVWLPGGTLGPFERQCGSVADGTVGVTGSYPISQVSCGSIGVHDRLLLMFCFAFMLINWTIYVDFEFEYSFRPLYLVWFEF